MEHIVRMPDVGEGLAEAELVEWNVKIGDSVREDMMVAAVMTDKATVEIPSPVSGTVTWLGGDVGEKIAINAPLIKIETGANQQMEAPEPASAAPEATKSQAAPASSQPADAMPLASPAVRQRAKEAGVDLRDVPATGPGGRITNEDFERFLQQGEGTAASGKEEITQIKITGLRRRIAERMSLAASRIPHITYVEEVDMTALEELRARLNEEGGGKLTILPFLMKAMAQAVKDHPAVNALFDDEKGVVFQHKSIHIGIATQTPSGLMVPVVRHVETLALRDCAAEMARVTEAARDGSATREELSGSTITISSLGALGGLVSTPIINHPEVAIVGVNKLTTKPVWNGSEFMPRQCMNLSSSFDHRVIDGWDAATFIQRVKALLEEPDSLVEED
jgi:2-oxoisovalerate dehydrogenase E2 component (dihydrolipoyl transacylase)